MISNLQDITELATALQTEKVFLSNYLNSQKRTNAQLYVFLKNFVKSNVVSNLPQSQKACNDLSNIVDFLKKSNSNIECVEILLDKINLIDVNLPNYQELIDDYNSLYLTSFDDVVKRSTELDYFLSEFTKRNDNSVEQTSSDVTEENTLVISEIDNKVILPFTMEELNQILENNPEKYSTIKDVIDRVYTKPLKYYHYSSIMRFKEAFKLVRKREHGSFTQALDLAFELFSNYNLHPAVITACKTLDELDIYLSCLEYNELNDFHFFKTIFRMHPLPIKST